MDAKQYAAVVKALEILHEKYGLPAPYEPDIEIDAENPATDANCASYAMTDEWQFATSEDIICQFTPQNLLDWAASLPDIEYDEANAAFVTPTECCVCVQETRPDMTLEYLNLFLIRCGDEWEVSLSSRSQLKFIGLCHHFLRSYRAKDLVQSELAVVVRRMTGIASKKEMLSVANAFRFEMSTTHGIQLEVARPFCIYDAFDTEPESLPPIKAVKMRPLIPHGEAMAHFMNAELAGSVDHQLLGYYKVLEHFGPAVLRMDAHEKLARLLDEPSALNPDRAALDRFLEVSDDYRNAKDSGLIRAVVERCCSLRGLSEFPGLQKFYARNEDRATIRAIADALYATRNEVVHAKANFKSHGEEIPQDLRVEAVGLARKLAEQTIRWEARLPAHLKK